MAEEIFYHKQIEDNTDIIEMRIWKVPKSKEYPEGIRYSLVYIRHGKRLVGYDNFGGHSKDGNFHHKHIKNKIIHYDFKDEWKLIEDFNEDVEKIRKGAIQ